MERSYDRVFPYIKEQIDGKLRRTDGRNLKAESDGPHHALDGITITVDVLPQALKPVFTEALRPDD